MVEAPAARLNPAKSGSVNHSDVVKELKEVGIESLYHNYWNEEQGKEKRPTLFIQCVGGRKNVNNANIE